MSQCLVTGVAGFIGSHLAERLLALGHSVLGIDVKRTNIEWLARNPCFVFEQRDVAQLTEGDLPGDLEYVFHLAGRPGVRDSWDGNFAAYLYHNVQATQHLLDILKTSSIRRLVFASSSSVYGEAAGGAVLETQLPCPISPYGVSKLAAERLCIAYASQFSLPVTALRYFSVYGPRQRPDMAFHRFFKAQERGEPVVIFGTGVERRDYTYVGDVVDASIAAMSAGGCGEIFNIASGRPVAMNNALLALEQVTGGRIARRYIERQKGDPVETAADITKARLNLGFSPDVSLEEGLARQWEWMRASTISH